MMYVIYKNDGSIKHKMLNEFVQQGNSYENVIFVAIEGRNPSDYSLYAEFKLPNGNTTVGVSTIMPTTLEVYGIPYSGHTISLTSAETLLAGALQMNIKALTTDTEKVLVGFNTYITINETGTQPDDPIIITSQEYQHLIETIGQNVLKYETILKRTSLGSANDYELGQAIYVRTPTSAILYEIVGTEQNKVAQVVYNMWEQQAKVTHFEEITPSGTTFSNKLTNESRVRELVNEQAAYLITKDANGNSFSTRAELFAAHTFYNGRSVRTPTRNDYAYVLVDDEHDNLSSKYSYQGGTYPDGEWTFETIVSANFTEPQIAALNSGATEELINLLKNGKIQSVNIQYLTTTLANLYSIIGGDFGVFKPSDNEDSLMTFSAYLDTTQTPPTRRYNITYFGPRSYQYYSTLDGSTIIYNILFGNNPLATRYEYFTKDLIDTTSTGLSDNDLKVPSSKLVKGQLDEIKRVAVANSNSFVTSYNYTINNISSKIDTQGYKVKHYDNAISKWLEFADSQEFEEWVGQKPLLNNKLNSQEDILGATDLTQYGTGFIYVEDAQQSGYVITLNDFIKLFVVGDNLFITETDVPDRWWNGSNFYILETKDIRKTENSWQEEQTFNEKTLFRKSLKNPLTGNEVTIDEIANNIGETIKNTTSTTYSGSLTTNRTYLFTQALSSITIAAFEKIVSTGIGRWEITFNPTSNFVITLPSGKTIKWAEGEPLWDTNTIYTLLVQEGIDTDYIIYVARA